jgi:hypothetical protein
MTARLLRNELSINGLYKNRSFVVSGKRLGKKWMHVLIPGWPHEERGGGGEQEHDAKHGHQ